MGDLLSLPLKRPTAPRLPLRRGTPATEHYERGVALEATDPSAAMTAYERAIAGRPELSDAHNNLARLLHDDGQLARAESCYRIALCVAPSVALYWFNLGVVVEDQGRRAEAIAHYEHALSLDAALADAHYNLARLYELTARGANDELLLHRAVRHLVRYKRLAKTTALSR
ncbi:MAG TPA: tetratricopeptide repeat protein [Kofleriaceae bacterium]|nr:tetratricopeptide repeat protein [Kofleriaceae bacterium]